MELKQLKENIYYISNPTNIGIIESNSEVILIDSGLDDDTARKILRVLEEEDWKLKAIINTHSHSDHCGGNAYLQEKTNVDIYAAEIEAEMIERPCLKPLCFFSGASPISELKNKFLMGRPSEVDYIIEEDNLVIDDVELKIVSLPGHALNQIGIEVKNILFCGDTIFSKAVLRKHKIPFCIDIDKHKETLSSLKKSDYDLFVPAHGRPVSEIIDLVEVNLNVIEKVEEYIIDNSNEAKTTEQIVKGVCNNYGVKTKGIQQYYLIKTAVMAYLSALEKREELELIIDDNLLYWRRTK
jgi:glyoxylase-like metal-dependent hydrolase (beta-lactamase superfamily II)